LEKERSASGSLFGDLLQAYHPREITRYPCWLEKGLIRLSLVLAFGFFGLQTGYFGVGDIADRFTYRIYNLFTAPFHDTAERDSVPLVLVDDHDLKRHDWLWPMDYGQHSHVLEEILKFEPRAVFMDFFLIDRRDDPSLDRLVRILEDYKAAGVPVFVPVARFTRQRAELRQLTRETLAELETDPFAHDEYFLKSGRYVSPAFALYRYACEKGDCGVGAKGEFDVKRFSSPLQIEWGLVPSALNEFLEGCSYEAKQGTWEVFTRVVGTSLWRGAGQAEEICPYMPLISLTNLMRRGFPKDLKEAFAGELINRIRGRDVIYSQAIFGVSPFVDPPTNPPVSAGYRHAMALENLRTEGPRYLKTELEVSIPGMDGMRTTFTPATFSSVTFVLLAVFHAFASFSTDRFLETGDRALRRRLLAAFVANAFYLSILFGIAAVQVFILRLSPVNLVALFGLIALVRGVTGSFYTNRLETFLARASGCSDQGSFPQPPPGETA